MTDSWALVPQQRYRTIVVDPPWDYPEGCVALGPGHGELRAAQPLPYESMSFESICAMPVRELADRDCRLFLWTTNRWLPDAFDVMGAWGFRYRQTLVWHKTDTNLVGSIAPNAAEFLLVGTRGAPRRLTPLPANVIASARSGGHSRKPDYWLDHIEAASPGPYAELFSRRARFGWDYPIGDQSLGGVPA